MKNAKLLMIFQPYGRNGSELSLEFPEPDMNINLRCSQYGSWISKKLKDHLTLVDDLYGTDYLSEVTAWLLMENADFPKHVSRCHAYYGNAAPDSVKQLIVLKEKYGIDIDNYNGITSYIAVGKTDDQ